MKQFWSHISSERILIGLLLSVFGGIVLQGPLSVGLGSLWPDYELLIKSWKEILLLIAGLILLVQLCRRHQFGRLRDPLLLLIAAYGLLHLLLLLPFWQGTEASLAGLMIDLRYVLFFGLVYVSLQLYPTYRPLFMKVAIAGGLVVLGFAILQVTVLPPDILKYLGYSDQTIVPYLTVDLNPAFIRINSTLRGPNPVGAYAVIALALVLAASLKRRLGTTARAQVIAAILAAGGLVALWASYSRSAWLAALLAAAVILAATWYKTRPSRRVVSIVVGGIVIIGTAVVLLGGSSFLSNVALHDNPHGGSATTSDEGHLASLSSGVQQLVTQPLGAGVGSTGSASLYGSSPLIIENQYLLIAHEVGWLGLALFLALFGLMLRRLWARRADDVALGVVASGLGLALIGVLLPVWADDTIGIIWWGLAAVALAGPARPRYTKKIVKE